MQCARGLILSLSVFSIVIPMQRASGQSKPYSIEDVVEFVRAGVSDSTTLKKVKANCIDFHVTSDAAARLRAASADDALLAGLVFACYKAKHTEVVTRPPRSRPVPARDVIRHDTVLMHDTVVVAPRQSTVVQPRPISSETGPVVIPEGAEVAALLEQSISSKDARLGDQVRMTVAADVVVRGHIVIAKGSPVRAEVSEVKPAGYFGRGGKLTLRLLGTKAVDDQQVRLRGTREASGDNNTASALALSLLYGAGLLRHGEDITIAAGTMVPVFTDEAVKVTPPPR